MISCSGTSTAGELNESREEVGDEERPKEEGGEREGEGEEEKMDLDNNGSSGE